MSSPPNAFEIKTSFNYLGGVTLIVIDTFSAIKENRLPRQSIKQTPTSFNFSM
jgi:hypothetical protein